MENIKVDHRRWYNDVRKRNITRRKYSGKNVRTRHIYLVENIPRLGGPKVINQNKFVRKLVHSHAWFYKQSMTREHFSQFLFMWNINIKICQDCINSFLCNDTMENQSMESIAQRIFNWEVVDQRQAMQAWATDTWKFVERGSRSLKVALTRRKYNIYAGIRVEEIDARTRAMLAKD